MLLGRIGHDIKSFISGKDLVVFAVGIALSNQLQATLKSIIDNLIMPLVSNSTGVDNLSNRSYTLHTSTIEGKQKSITLNWGAALQSVITLFISLVVMVEVARYITTHYVKSSSVTF